MKSRVGIAEELPGLVQRGVGWMMASQGAMQVLALMTSVVMAHFLSPRQVGLATEAVVFVSLALVLVDFGFASVIVQRPTLTDVDLSTLFWAGNALGIALSLAGVALSGPLAALYGEPQVRGLFAVMSLTFAVTAPGIVQGALLTRELNFRSLELRTIAATVSSCTVAMALAALGAGPWAIVAQTITIATVSTMLLWRSSSWRPRAQFSVPSLRAVLAFSSDVFGSRMLTWGNANLDNFLVGRFIGAASLGAYSLAFAVALTPVTRIAIPVTQVFFPAFSRIRNPEGIAEVWLRAERMLAFVVVPAMMGLIVTAPDFVNVVFGHRWRAAAPVMQILAMIALLQALTALNDGILQALAQTRTLFRFTLALSLATVTAFAAGLPWGITGVATAYLIATVILQPIFLWLTLRRVGVSIGGWLRSVGGVLEAGGVMLIVVLLARKLLLGTDVAVGVRLLLLTIVGIGVYLPVVLWRAPEVKTEMRGVSRRRRAE